VSARVFRGVLFAVLVSVPGAMVACGPDGRSVGSSCPDLPLYRSVYDPDTKTWVRVHLESADASRPLNDAEVQAIATAEQEGCITPVGSANSITETPGDGGAATSSALDAGSD
jgi:hypothetical protein